MSSLSAGASLPSAGERSAPFLVVSADPAYGSISPDSAALDSGVQVFTLLGTDLELVAAVMLAGCDGDITTTELVHVSATELTLTFDFQPPGSGLCEAGATFDVFMLDSSDAIIGTAGIDVFTMTAAVEPPDPAPQEVYLSVEQMALLLGWACLSVLCAAAGVVGSFRGSRF